jgi:uncharacterized protein involved in response to NO
MAAASLVGWLAALFGYLILPSYPASTLWHAHEMLFGYTAAVIAGFLLTAARNWSGLPTAVGAPLAALVALWLAARLAPWLGAPTWLTTALNVAFFPALALSLRKPLWSGPNPANRLFLVVFGGLTLATAMVNLGSVGPIHDLATRGQRLMLDLIIVVMLIMAGRVMPFFTRAAIPDAVTTSRPWVEGLGVGTALMMLALHLLLPASALTHQLAGLAAVAAGLLLFARLAGWHNRRAWGLPMLAVLYLGFVWLGAGLILDGLAAFQLLPSSIALHAITVGAIGTLTLGMMARVTLGHTGRPMRASRLTVLAFGLVTAAAVLRSAAIWLEPGLQGAWLLVSGFCWSGAFALFTAVYAPMLVTPRVDGKPG